jgi:L-rhamnose-H+ transport protein
MSEAVLTGLLLALVAGFSNGSFFVPMRYVRRWQWENTWLVFTFLSQIVLPWLAAWLVIPHLFGVLRASPWGYFLPGLVAGFFWGIAQVTYGLSVRMVGIAAGNAIVSGVATVTGTVGPLIVYAPERVLTATGLIFFAAIAVTVCGVYVYGRAGIQRERETSGREAGQGGAHGDFRTGMIVCLATGLLGTAFIYGFASSTELVRAAEAAGAKPLFAGYVAWAVTFSAGFISNLLYCLYQMRKNQSARALISSGCFLRNTSLAGSMGILWYGGVLMYGMAAARMGRLGPSVGFGLFVSGTILFATVLGYLIGEWRGASRETIRGFLKGMLLIIAGIAVLTFAVARNG